MSAHSRPWVAIEATQLSRLNEASSRAGVVVPSPGIVASSRTSATAAATLETTLLTSRATAVASTP